MRILIPNKPLFIFAWYKQINAKHGQWQHGTHYGQHGGCWWRAPNVKEHVFLTPSNVKPLTGVPCGLFYSFYSATIQFLRSRTTQPQTRLLLVPTTHTYSHTHTHVLRQRRGQGKAEVEARERRGRRGVCSVQVLLYSSTFVESRQTMASAPNKPS